MNFWSSRLCRSVGTSSALLGSVLLANQVRDEKKDPWAVMTEYPMKSQRNDISISRKITSPHDHTGLNLRLYQFQTCPYCCKVRAFLDYYGFSYEVVEVEPVRKKQIKFSPDHKKVPIVTTSATEKPLIESSQIISILATYLKKKDTDLKKVLDLYPEHREMDMKSKKEVTVMPHKFFVMLDEATDQDIQYAREEREWREWIDNHFIHLISPNVYRTWTESLETFDYFDRAGEWKRNFSSVERLTAIYLGAAIMYLVAKQLKTRHNITDERKAMKDAFKEFLEAKGGRKFMGGDEPNLADLSLYGAINSFVGCRAFAEMRNETKIGQWFEDVHTAVAEHRGSKLLEQVQSNS